MSDIYDIEIETLEGERASMGDYRGKVLLIVNVASRCGKTPQYEGLEVLHRELGERGLVVLGFPCNQFGAQEPGSAEEIRDFCDANYGVTFPMHAKLDVNGDDAHSLYRYLTTSNDGDPDRKEIAWNFEKFLVNRAGEVVARFGSRETPEQIRPHIEQLL